MWKKLRFPTLAFAAFMICVALSPSQVEARGCDNERCNVEYTACIQAGLWNCDDMTPICYDAWCY
jgi:hypothetical protein